MTATNMCYNFVGFRYSPPLTIPNAPLITQIFKSSVYIIIMFTGLVSFTESRRVSIPF